MKLAIFDLDNTLIAGDSDHSWGEFLVQKGHVDAAYYRAQNDRFYQEYKNGTLDNDAYLKFSLAPLAQLSAMTLASLHQEFLHSVVEPMMLPKAEALLKEHRDQGHFLLIITATNDFITYPIAKRLGVDEILATNAELIDGCYTGKVSGTPCFKEGKVTRLNQWLEERGFSLKESYFYSDSINDLPLLEVVTYPVAVDPDDLLGKHAKQQGWPIMSLRD